MKCMGPNTCGRPFGGDVKSQNFTILLVQINQSINPTRISQSIEKERKTSWEGSVELSIVQIYSLRSESINQYYSLWSQPANWERKKDIMRGGCGVVNSQNFIPSGHNQSLGARWPNLASFVNGKWRQGRQGTSVTDKEAVNASLRGFFVFSTTQVTSLQPAFKMDLSLLCLPLYSQR